MEQFLKPRWHMIVTVLLVGGIFRIAYVLPSRAFHNDFAHYYLSSRTLIEGQDPYSTPLEPLYAARGFVFDTRIPTATNPPPLLWLIAPFSGLPVSAAHLTWSALNALSLVACLLMTRRMACAHWSPSSWWFAIVAVVWSYPVYDHFLFSQVQLELAALLIGAFGLNRAGKPGAACGFVALAAALKIFPIVMLPWFILHSATGWREISRRLMIAGVIGAAIFVATGPALWQGFLQNGLPVISANITNQGGNQSIPSLVLNMILATHDYAFPAETEHFWRKIASMIGAMFLFTAYAIVWLKKLESRVAFGILLLATVVSSPTAWTHYLVLLLWPAIIAIDLTYEQPGRLRVVACVVMVTLFLFPIGDWLMGTVLTDPPIAMKFLLGYLPLIGTSISGGLLLSSAGGDQT